VAAGKPSYAHEAVKPETEALTHETEAIETERRRGVASRRHGDRGGETEATSLASTESDMSRWWSTMSKAADEKRHYVSLSVEQTDKAESVFAEMDVGPLFFTQPNPTHPPHTYVKCRHQHCKTHILHVR